MAPLRLFFARDSSNGGDDEETGLTPATVNLLISLLVLVLFGITLLSALLVLRQKRRSKQSQLPVYNRQPTQSSNRLTITASQGGRTESIYVYNEKRNLLENSSSPPSSPVPEIRITFPEEEDESGNRKSGRVVVVRISEQGGVGLEPYQEDLPPYQSNDSGRFHSLDLERMGGLKEKEDGKRWS